MHFAEKNITLIKMKRNRNWGIPHTGLERRTLCFSSYRNRKLQVKLRRVGARQRKMRAFFVLCVLSQCIVCCIHFQNIHTFTY